jgi:hypothetical protein
LASEIELEENKNFNKDDISPGGRAKQLIRYFSRHRHVNDPIFNPMETS